MDWINTLELKYFARQLESRSILPYYIRELITATTPEGSIVKIRFPYKEDVNLGGVDGELICSEKTLYVPEGHSIWEFGQKAGLKGKADEDYLKRTNNPKGFDPKDSTFIFVTAKQYTVKDDWIAEKKNLKQWKDVRFYDASDLEHWFNESPVVGSQLAKEGIGRFPFSVKALDIYWNEWCITNSLKFTHEIMLGGREAQKNYTIQFLLNLLPDSGKKNRLIIKCNSKEEAAAFVCAVIETFEVELKSSFYSKSILIKDSYNFDYIVNKKPPHIILNETNNHLNINSSCLKNHKIIIPILNNELTHDIELLNLEKNIFIDELKKLKVDENTCETYFDNTQGDLLKLKLLLV